MREIQTRQISFIIKNIYEVGILKYKLRSSSSRSSYYTCDNIQITKERRNVPSSLSLSSSHRIAVIAMIIITTRALRHTVWWNDFVS